jgi:P4 family phage/plasmid primase-like protien
VSVYGAFAVTYFNAGWRPLPIHTSGKKSEVKGFHGYIGEEITRKNVLTWQHQFRESNIALRLPANIVGIDVDAYGEKKGAQSLAKLESELGPLPATSRTTSREDPHSGIRLYRLPDHSIGIRMVGRIAPDIDLIHWGNRYAVVYPSVHPSGRVYQWIMPTGDVWAPTGDPSDLPNPLWLPVLPEAWVARLRAPVAVPDDVAASNPPRFTDGEGTKPGLAVLRKELDVDWPEMRETQGWNNALFVSSKRIAELVAGGDLDYGASRRALIAMALNADPEMEGVEATVDSGFRAGLLHPRKLKELPSRFYNTDASNASLFVHLHGEDLHYVYLWKSWFMWDGRRWQKVIDGSIMRRTADVSTYLYKQAAKESDDDKRKEIAKHAISMENAGKRASMLEVAQSHIDIDIMHDRLDAHSNLFTTQNGMTYDSEAMKARPVSRTDLITKLIGTDHLPEARCPTWETFLARALPDKDVRAFVQRAIGYTLTGSTQEKALFVVFGPPDTGKSKFVETILALMGDYGHTLKDDSITNIDAASGNNDDLANLVGTRFVLLDELPEGAKLNASLVKKLTGSTSYTAQRKYEKTFTYKPEFKIWIDTNFRPHVDADDDAMWTRVKLVPFSVVIPKIEQDPHLSEKLHNELPGILNWALNGLKDWRTAGLREPQGVRAATQAYRDSEDDLAQFIREMCNIGPDEKVLAERLTMAYNLWSGCKLSPRAFRPKMIAKGFASKPMTKGQTWSGLSLKTGSAQQSSMVDGG